MITDEAKTVEELREQCSAYAQLLEKVQGLLLEAQAQISALEKECDRYGLLVSRQDEEITRLRRDCTSAGITASPGEEKHSPEITELAAENDRLRQRLSDLYEYLEITRADGKKLYL